MSTPRSHPLTFVASSCAVLAVLLACSHPASPPRNDDGSTRGGTPTVLRSLEQRLDPVRAAAAAEQPVIPAAPDTSNTISASSSDERAPTRKTWAELAAGDVHYGQLLAGAHSVEGAVSVGSATHGRLHRGVRIPVVGKHHRILPDCVERETNYATEELVQLLDDVSARVAKAHPGSVLDVCNAAKKGGGNISWSRSHNSGRDVDLGFFMYGPDGSPVAPEALPKFNSNLVTWDETKFLDVPRNWSLVKALLTHESIEVQWIFVFKHLRKAMLRHAKHLGEDDKLLERAEYVLMQPSDSARHNDHFHVRIFCSPEDRGEGCVNDEPVWPWVTIDESHRVRRAAVLFEGVRDSDPDVRAAIIDLIERGQIWEASVALAQVAIFDDDYRLRLRAAEILRSNPWRWGDKPLMHALEVFLRGDGGGVLEDDPDYAATPATVDALWPSSAIPGRLGEGQPREVIHFRRVYKLLSQLASPHSAALLGRAAKSKRILGDGVPDERPRHEARLAADAAQHVLTFDLVEPLIDALDHPDGRTRRDIAMALRNITNHRMGLGWSDGLSDEQLAKNQSTWRSWWTEHKHRDRDDLLIRGFRQQGVRVTSFNEHDCLDPLIAATKQDSEAGYNADRLLSEITGRWSPHESRASSKHKRWSEWRASAPKMPRLIPRDRPFALPSQRP